jgi:hypothetical protein
MQLYTSETRFTTRNVLGVKKIKRGTLKLSNIFACEAEGRKKVSENL